MRFASLGSGSNGNGLVIEKNNTRLLLDCGFGLKDAIVRLQRLGLNPDQLTGILVTHEHEDHASGVFKIAAKYSLPIWLTHGTLSMVGRYLPREPKLKIHVIDSHLNFQINDLEICPFTVPHDAREPVQYVIQDGQSKLGVLTDTGTSTPHIEMMLSGCNGLVLECNHDLDMLMNGPYAWSLKKRVSSRLGHLDNASSAAILGSLDTGKLQHIVAAHLSAKNNSPELARKALSAVLNCEMEWIGIADQDNGLAWRTLS